jgi:hypothetical protein
MYEINKAVSFKTLWLNTTDAIVDADRKRFVFNDLSLIQIRNKSYLKVNSITLSGDGVGSAPGHNWEVKLAGVKINQPSYFNSDNNFIPTIAMLNYDSNNSVQNGHLTLELENQDIVQLALHIVSDDNHGLIKNSQNIDMHIGLSVEEYME